MFKPNFNTDIKTNYNLKLVDSQTGNVKRELDTHNTFCTNFWKPIIDYWHRASGRFAFRIQVGNGTGTPTESDTALFSPLWMVDAEESYETPDHTTLRATAVAEFPATESYVGTVTEIGIMHERSGYYKTTDLITHALLQDAEGAPISIEKSDVDRLIVTVTLTFTFSVSSPWTIWPVADLIGRARLKTGDTNANHRPFAQLWQDMYFCLGVQPEICLNYGYNKTSSGDSGGASGFYYPAALPDTCYDFVKGVLNQSTKKVTFANTRMTTDFGKNRPVYFNFVAIPGYCYAKLPNADIFPFYTIEDIRIGVGDGTTTDFLNPLNYFPKNGETIYKNGTALVRGTDYTIDNCPNFDLLPELTDSENWTFLSGIHTKRSNYQLFQRFLKYHNSFYQGENEDHYTGFLKNNPLIIDMGTAHQVNTLHLPKWFGGGTYTLFCSDDKETWTELATVQHNYNTDNLVEISSSLARYWKIETSIGGWSEYSTSNRSDVLANELFLGYVGDKYIHFTTPPTNGDVLTMKVTMDRPFKNGNFVIDCSAEMSI